MIKAIFLVLKQGYFVPFCSYTAYRYDLIMVEP